MFLTSYFGLKLCIAIVRLTAVSFKLEFSQVCLLLFVNEACARGRLISSLIAMLLS